MRKNKNKAEQLPLSQEVFTSVPNYTTYYNVTIALNASIMHYTTSPHAVAVYNHAYSDSIYKQCTKKDEAKTSIINHPLPLISQQSLEITVIISGLAAHFLLIPLCIPGAFVVPIVRENACKAKHVQLVSGVNMSAYWVAHYLWDMMMYSCISFLITLIL